ncbi:MAG: hypothetical protein ABJC89_13245 [Acidobacteriota bacterium]
MSTTQIAAADPAPVALASLEDRRRTSDRIFRGALIFNAGLTILWLFSLITARTTPFFQGYRLDREAVMRVGFGILFFYVVWGFIWYGVKTLLLRFAAGFTKEERRVVFSSRMRGTFDLPALLSRHSERRIRIIDMVGRRGRFITLQAPAFYYLYSRIAEDRSQGFATLFLQDNLFDAVATSWIFLAFFYADNFLAAAFYGPQSRIMDGVLARANCLLITTLWTVFKFVMVPLGAKMAVVFPPGQFAVLFALIWGSYMMADAFSEIGGSLYGKQTIRVLGIGDVNRKSIGGTVSGFVASLALCVGLVVANHLSPAWIGLAIVIAVSNTVLELFSPRGTDDFVMASANAVICLAFGLLLY